MYDDFERGDLILDFIDTVILVIGGIVLPHIPIALRISLNSNFYH